MSLIFGGDSIAKNIKNIFEVYAEKAPKGVKTTFHVWAATEDEAREQIYLNGWKVLSIKKLNQKKDIQELSLKGDSVNVIDTISQEVDNLTYKESSKHTELKFPQLKFVADVYFELGSYDADFSVLDNISFSKDKIYFIYGYTDTLPVKPNDRFKTNYELSILRGEQVKKYLTEKRGLNPENLKVAGLGEFYPKKDNTFKGNPVNRRVEIYEYR